MGKLDIQLLRKGSWQSEFVIEKKTNFSELTKDRTLLERNILPQSKYGIKLVYSGIKNALADMSFNDINLNHTIF